MEPPSKLRKMLPSLMASSERESEMDCDSGIDQQQELPIASASDVSNGPSLTNTPSSIEDKDIDEVECYPRSEYRSRYEGTSVFAMKEFKFWGTYFRSSAQGGNGDRLSASKDKKYQIKAATPAKAGTMIGPWQRDAYKNILSCAREQCPQRLPDGGLLYDLLLDYKLCICEAVFAAFQSCNEDLELGMDFKNNYPCLIVYAKTLKASPKEDYTGVYKILTAYYAAFVNKEAEMANVPIEMTIRASFGHNVPTVNGLGKIGFRINTGLVPEIYVKVLIESLRKLDAFVRRLLGCELSLGRLAEDKMLQERNHSIKQYNIGKQNVDNPGDAAGADSASSSPQTPATGGTGRSERTRPAAESGGSRPDPAAIGPPAAPSRTTHRPTEPRGTGQSRGPKAARTTGAAMDRVYLSHSHLAGGTRSSHPLQVYGSPVEGTDHEAGKGVAGPRVECEGDDERGSVDKAGGVDETPVAAQRGRGRGDRGHGNPASARTAPKTTKKKEKCRRMGQR